TLAPIVGRLMPGSQSRLRSRAGGSNMSENETAVPSESSTAVAEAPAAEKAKKAARVTLKVSEKGALSVYGLGRFPVTLYKEQWLRLLEHTEEIRAFVRDN